MVGRSTVAKYGNIETNSEVRRAPSRVARPHSYAAISAKAFSSSTDTESYDGLTPRKRLLEQFSIHGFRIGRSAS